MYDEKTGERQKTRLGDPLPRPAIQPPVCRLCPKKSPAEAWQHELSAKNEETWALYQQLKAAPYLCPEEWRGDPILMRNLSLCRRVEDAVAERREQLGELRARAMLRTVLETAQGTICG